MKVSAALSRITGDKSLLGQAVVILLGTQLLFLASFTNLTLPTATGKNISAWAKGMAAKGARFVPAQYRARAYEYFPGLSEPAVNVRYSSYVPQVPAAVLVGYTLGPLGGLISTVLFLLLGIFGPYFGLFVFASGGGADYYREPGMGYLVGLAAASWCTGVLAHKKKTGVPSAAAMLCGVVSVHLIGMVYVIAICLAANFFYPGRLYPSWRPWIFEEIRNLTWYQIPYDFLFGLAALVIGVPLRRLADTLAAPDVAGKRVSPDRLEELLDQ